MKLWNVYNLESGRILRMLGQLKARNEQASDGGHIAINFNSEGYSAILSWKGTITKLDFHEWVLSTTSASHRRCAENLGDMVVTWLTSLNDPKS